MAREESDPPFNGDSLKIHRYWVKKYPCRYQTDTRTLPLALVLAGAPSKPYSCRVNKGMLE